MSDFAYHMEALRKARVFERARQAKQNQASKANPNVQKPYGTRPEPGGYEKEPSLKLERFRIREDGFRNRYPAGEQSHPYCDLSYRTIYPSLDNSDYTCDSNRANRRQNVAISSYEARAKVNGTADVAIMHPPDMD